jgi:integrase
MYAKNSRRKAKAGSVQVSDRRGYLRIIFTHGGKRHFIATGFPNTPLNRKLAQETAFQIQRDIEYGEFDPTYQKYKPQSALTTVDDVTPLITAIPTLSELWSQYSEVRKPGKSPSTVRMYGWIANHLERCPHKSPNDSQAVFDWLSGHVPAESTKRLLTQLSACCKWARKSGLLDSNPFDGMAAEVKTKKTGTEEEEINPFTKEERDRIIAAFKENRYYKYYAPLVEFLFYTGCRPSEAVALQWKHISSSTVTFERALVYGGRAGLVLKKGLKTQERRKFPVNSQLATLLKAIRPFKYDPETLVFPSRQEKLIDWHNFTNRAWMTVLKSLPDIEYRNPYQTKHTFCSLCRAADIPSIQIAKWVGTSPEMIDRVYAKPTDHIQVPEL